MTGAGSSSTSSPIVAPHNEAVPTLRNQHPEYHSSTEQPEQPSSWEHMIGDPIAVFAFLLVAATMLLWLATRNLQKATVKMANDARAANVEQAEKMERSIAEAAKAAVAMEGVAKSMAINAEQVVKSVGISADIAKHQRLFGQMQMRAYVSVLIGRGTYQDARLKFQVEPKIINTGHTPARNLRWRIASNILPVPLPEDFRFPLEGKGGGGGNILGPGQDGYMAAVVPERIDDARAVSVKYNAGQEGLYVWGFLSYEDVFGVTHRTTFNQQIYWVPRDHMAEDGRVPEDVHGLYLSKHNRAS